MISIEMVHSAKQLELFICDQPLVEGFSLKETRLHLISESELFGEMRLGLKKRGRKAKGEPINFTELREGDVVVHREHGLGLYRGLETISLQAGNQRLHAARIP